MRPRKPAPPPRVILQIAIDSTWYAVEWQGERSWRLSKLNSEETPYIVQQVRGVQSCSCPSAKYHGPRCKHVEALEQVGLLQPLEDRHERNDLAPYPCSDTK